MKHIRPNLRNMCRGHSHNWELRSQSPWRLKWAGHVTGMREKMKSCKILVGKSLGESTFGRLRKRLKASIEMGLKETGSEDQMNSSGISSVELSGAATFVLVLSFLYLLCRPTINIFSVKFWLTMTQRVFGKKEINTNDWNWLKRWSWSETLVLQYCTMVRWQKVLLKTYKIWEASSLKKTWMSISKWNVSFSYWPRENK